MEKYLCKILRIYDTNMTTNIKNLPNISAYNIEPHHRKYVHCNETKKCAFQTSSKWMNVCLKKINKRAFLYAKKKLNKRIVGMAKTRLIGDFK